MANGYNLANDRMAQTLNHALGNLGGGTRSWMHPFHSSAMPTSAAHIGESGPPAVSPNAPTTIPRQRGRPRKQPAPIPLPDTATAQPPVEPQMDRQPSSTSASPHLANVLTGQDRRPSVTILPSPSPSVENLPSVEDLPLPNAQHAGAASTPNLFPFGAAQTDGAIAEPMGAANFDPATRQIRHTKRHSTDVNERVSKRPALGGDRHASASANIHHAAISRPQSTGPPRSLSYQPPPHHSPDADQTRPQGSVPDFDLPLHERGGPVEPRNTPAYSAAATSYNMPMQSIHHANTPEAWYTTGECFHMLDVFERSRGARGAWQPDDKARLNVLRSAVEGEDWMFLIIHQIYCLQDVQPSALPPHVSSQAAWPDALHMLQTVLNTNRALSGDVQMLFANFPYPMHVIHAKWPQRFNKLLTRFLSFMFCSSRFPALKTSCQKRRFPPLVSELVSFLAVDSYVMQRVLFTSVLRSIWHAVPPNNRREQQAIKYFLQNQAEFEQTRMRSAEQGRDHSGQSTLVDGGGEAHWGPLLRQVIDACDFDQGRPGIIVPNELTPLQRTPFQQQQSQYQLQQSQLRQQQLQQQQRQQQQLLRQLHEQVVFSRQPVSSPETHTVLRSQPTPQPHPSESRRAGRMPTQPVLPSARPPYQSRPKVPLLPAPGVQLMQQRMPNPARFSLHQAHLRSPVPKARVIESPLYQYVEGFLTSPARLSTANRAMEKWSFNLTADMVQTVAQTIPGTRGQVGHRLVDENSKTLRLRCIKWTGSDRPTDHIWATAETSWVPYSCFRLNGTLLEQRKKAHHGKDLPIDITEYVKEGDNALEIVVTSDSHDKTFLDYLVAIEFLGITSHETVKRNCLEKQFKSTEEIMANLKTKLSSGSGEDEDVAIVESKLAINLFCPFSHFGICDIPVRSRACLHNDCFDLETFLGAIPRKGDVSDPAHWRCPICRADARPNYLITDGFLTDVKKVLDAQGLSQTRAIVVQQDGSWEPKAEVRDPNGVSDESPTPTARQASVVIDLSD